CADARHLELVHQIARGEHGAFAIGRVHEFHENFRSGKGDAVELEVTGFLDIAIGDRYVGDDGFLNVALPDAHYRPAIFGNAIGIDETVADGKGTHRSGEVPAVAAPVDEGLVDGYLPEEVVHVMIRTLALG